MNISSSSEDTRFLELLRKWQSGDFTRADEQEMNALAKGDEFRLEALEGFLEHPELDHAARITSLQERIQGKKTGRRIAFPQIWAIAAALALIFGAIWFFNIKPVPQDEGQVVQNLPEPPVARQEELRSAPAPSLDKMPVQSDASRQINGQQPASPMKAPVAAAPEKDMVQMDKKATDDEVQAIQSEDLAETELKQSRAYEPPSGGVKEQSTNSARPEELAKESTARAKKKQQSAKTEPVYDNAKADKPGAGKSVVSSNAPALGWEEFRRYLNANARLTPAARANNISGTVRLKFQVDTANQAANFQIIKSLGYGCDEEAIRLVSAAAWIRGDDQAITVDVPFVR